MVLKMLIVCFQDAMMNLYENRKNSLMFIIFLTISFMGIVITDSLIYSVSQKAESELKIYGDNIISVNLFNPISINKVREIFPPDDYTISISRKAFFNTGESPFDDEIQPITGVDDIRINLWKIKLEQPFDGNAIVYSGQNDNPDSLFINGIPFTISGKMKKKSTDFLNSLGLDNNDLATKIVIPLETLFRLTIDNTIDNIEIIKDSNIDRNHIEDVENKLIVHNVKNFSVSSFLDAKKTVTNVMGRFGVLTNSIYIMLTIMALVTVHMVSRRNFQLRCTEFAIKVIHGVNKRILVFVVILETFIVTVVSVLISTIIAFIVMHFLSGLLMTSILLRFNMVLFSISIVILSCYIFGTLYGVSFFNKNPLQLIKERMQ